MISSSHSTGSARGSSGALIGPAGRRRPGLCGNTTAAPGGGSSWTAEQRASTGAGRPSPPGSGRWERPAPRARLGMSGRRPRGRRERSERTEGAVSTCCCFIGPREPPPVTSRAGRGWRRQEVTTPKPGRQTAARRKWESEPCQRGEKLSHSCSKLVLYLGADSPKSQCHRA